MSPISAISAASRAAAQSAGDLGGRIDCLNDGEFNLVQGLAGNQCGLQGPYQVRHLCELIHIESARALATYRDDFYAGRPAVTVNAFGKGKARMWPPATI